MQNYKDALCIEFLPNLAQEDEGLGHAGIQTYRNNPFAGVARETGQNSRDAAKDLPVKITYDLLDVPIEDIPAFGSLSETINQCLKQSAGKEKEVAFFQQAIRVISDSTIKVLRISDFNTVGAKGPATAGTPFHSLVKGSGVSVKENTDSGGSFGIGKNAVFAVSDLQTIFYSTVYEELGETIFLAQGKTILVAHTDGSGQHRRQIGYWGAKDFKEVTDAEVLPKWMRREEVGTSVFILGFRETPDWQTTITYTLLQNFFPAIHKKEMEFSLDNGKFHIGDSTLPSLFKESRFAEVAGDLGYEFRTSYALYRCLASSEATEDIHTIQSLGKVQIRVLVEEGLSKKIVIVRNGMVITDSLEHFGDKLSRFPMYRDFVAVVTPLEQEGSAFIKKLEDPRHRELSAEGLHDEKSRAHAKHVMKQLAQKIRAVVKEKAVSHFAKEVSANEMRPYFSSETDGNDQNSEAKNEDPQKIRYKIEPRKQQASINATSAGTDDAGGGKGGGSKGPNVKPQNNGSGDGSKSTPGGNGRAKTVRPVHFQNVRNVFKDSRSRTIFFTSFESGTADILIRAAGLNESEQLPISAASNSEIIGGRIRREVIANERCNIEIQFEEEYNGPIEIHATMTVGGDGEA